MKVEKRKRSERLSAVGYAILTVVGVAGVITLATVAPGCIKLLGYALRHQSQKRYYIHKVAQRCIDRGLIARVKTQQGMQLRLTPKGKEILGFYEVEKLSIKKPKRWDGKYRIIIFDITERRRSVRDKLRTWLTHLGFVRLQQSVWVHPYECQEVVTLLKAYFHIGKDVLYLTVESLENDTWVKKCFDLA